MDHQKKLDFVLKMTKHALDSVQHLSSGGTVLNGPIVAGTNDSPTTSGGIAGGISGLLGTSNEFKATPALITPGTNTDQLNDAYTGAQGALGSATGLRGAVSPGLNQGVNSQNLLTQQLTDQTLGRGANPARASLNNNTGRNIAQAAAIAAGTRGAGTNAGLIASNAAQQAANTEQQAVGQEAALQAAQQLAAQQQLQGLSGVQVGQASNAVQLENQVQQGEQGILQGANTATNNQAVSSQNSINDANAKVAVGNQQNSKSTLGGVGDAIGSVLGFLFADGGEVPKHLHGMAQIYHPHLVGKKSLPMKDGGKVPGQPRVNRDSYQNDTVLAKLSPKEVVIDLDSLRDKGKLGKMARFVAKEIARKNAGRKLI